MGFPLSCEALDGSKAIRYYSPVRATLNAQSARHGARPWPKNAPSVQARPLRAPQPSARENIRRRNRKGSRRAEKLRLVHVQRNT